MTAVCHNYSFLISNNEDFNNFINDRNLRNHNDGPFEIQIDSYHRFNKKCNSGFMEIISFIDSILVLN